MAVGDLRLRRCEVCGESYVGSRGGRVDAAKRRWIESLVLPPAWHDARISADPNCHLLATGSDDAGRRQYRYHPDFRKVADDLTFARVAELVARIGDVRAAVAEAIGSDDERQQLTGIVVRLIDNADGASATRSSAQRSRAESTIDKLFSRPCRRPS